MIQRAYADKNIKITAPSKGSSAKEVRLQAA
jgi:hypothetical protein